MQASVIVVGGGINSAVGRVHQSALSICRLYNVANGYFSRNHDTHMESRKQWGVPADAYEASSYESLLEHYEDVEPRPLVLLLTPTPLHHRQCLLALKKGFPVISEKSICSTLPEAAEIKACVEALKDFFKSTFNYSGYPMVRELRAIVAEGGIGKVNQIQVEMPQEGFVRPPLVAGKQVPPQRWRLVDQEVPTVCLDLGVHLHHLVMYVTGLPLIPDHASYGNYTQYPGIIDTCSIGFTLDSLPSSGQMWFTKSAIGTRNGLRIRLFGSSGSLHWYQQSPELIHYDLINGSRQIIDRGSHCLVATRHRYERMKSGHPAGFIEAFANIYEDIHHDYMVWRDSGQDPDSETLGVDVAYHGMKFFAEASRLADSKV